MSQIEDDYRQWFQEDILHRAEAEGKLAAEVFFEDYTEDLMEAGEIPEAILAHYERQQRGRRAIRVDGYARTQSSGEGTILTLILRDFQPTSDLQTVTRTQIDQMFNRISNFVEMAIDPEFKSAMEETDPAFGLVDTMTAEWPQISQLRYLILSNRRLSTRVDRIEDTEFQGKPVYRSVWDFSRLHRLRDSGKPREDMEIDLEHDVGGCWSVLAAHVQSSEYASYLAVVPGVDLASIYERWGDRLLEQNVRVFLQARSNVNRGIRNTITNEPAMFFAYNNGITATAEQVELRDGSRGTELTHIRNFQIVNGGQTMGSIYTASRDGRLEQLSKVFVQMKLSVIQEEKVESLVPRISRNANSQNTVNLADFSANHPFHVQMEEFSRRILAPPAAHELKETKWFYERARGQHQQELARLTQTGRKQFNSQYPKRQKFLKTDVAKWIMVWEEKPHIVSLGAQKNFAYFSQTMNKAWDKQPTQFSEPYFRELVAKGIIFKGVEKMVASRPWYETGGYRANIVAYTISKLAHDVRRMQKGTVNFQEVWEKQEISPELMDALIVSADAVKDVILNPAKEGSRNISEWAKQEACWSRVKDLEVVWPASLSAVLMSAQERQALDQRGRKEQREYSGVQAQEWVLLHAADFGRVIQWIENTPDVAVSPQEMKLLQQARDINKTGRIPRSWQCQILVKLVSRLQDAGCPEEFMD